MEREPHPHQPKPSHHCISLGRHVAWLAWAVTTTIGGVALAELPLNPGTTPADGRSEPEPAPPSARIYVIGSTATVESLRRVVGSDRIGPVTVQWEQLDRFSADALLSKGGSQAPHARSYIDLSHTGKALIYFADRSSERFLVRALPVSRVVTELELEAIAQVLETGLGALMDSSSAGLSRETVEKILRLRVTAAPTKPLDTRAAPATSRAEAASYRPKAAAGYTLEAYSEQIPWLHGPGLSLGIVRHGQGQSQSLSLGVGYLLAQSYQGSPVGFQIRAYRLRAVLEFDLPLPSARGESAWTGTYLGFVLIGGANLMHVSARPGSPAGADLVTEPARTVAVPLGGVGVRFGYSFGSWLLSLGADLELALERLSFDVRVNGQLSPIDRSRLLLPTLLTQLEWQ